MGKFTFCRHDEFPLTLAFQLIKVIFSQSWTYSWHWQCNILLSWDCPLCLYNTFMSLTEPTVLCYAVKWGYVFHQDRNWQQG